MLVQKVFKEYADYDSKLGQLEERLSAWLSDTNFTVELGTIVGLT